MIVQKLMSRNNRLISIWKVLGQTFNTKFVIKIALLLTIGSWSDWIAAGELVGKTVMGSLFSVSVTSKNRDSNAHEFFNDLTIVYRSDEVAPARSYTFSAQAPALVTVTKFGLVSIGERVGGMNGTYTVTYLLPEPEGLKHIGSVEIGMSSGKFVSIATTEPRWDISVETAEREAWLDQVIHRAGNLLVSDEGSTDNAFLLFAVPELASRLSTSTPNFAELYAKCLISNVDSSIGNLIRRHFVGKDRSLCDDEQFDVFVCRTNQQVVSLCLDERDGLKRLEYRFGHKNSVELKLSKTINTKYDDFDPNASFLKGAYTYTIRDGKSVTPLVVVGKNGVNVLKRPCSGRDIESMIFPVR